MTAYAEEKEAAVAEVVKAYAEGASDVRGGMCNVLLSLAMKSDEGWLVNDLTRLNDALVKLSKLYEGPR